jgi:hypothetical protein
LARRLNAVVPRPFRLLAEGGRLQFYIDNHLDSISDTPEIVDDESRELGERLLTIVDSVLSVVQDNISEHLRTPWPSTDGRAMAMPGVRTDTEFVHLWYGPDEAAPVIVIPAIPINEIMTDNGIR